MSTEPRRRSRAKFVLTALTFVLVLSAQPGTGRASADAVLSAFGVAVGGTSRVFAFAWHVLSSAAMSCAGR
ncbi:hypothetical protein [Amycolatopsis pittospori]|uniref:hypothetical protein n=1 Tax=Amycolatopsis pittospori TaxID=2749434 RepID=UPI0015F07CA8|nr:hypothetical protein [Amycolatopsis pittospori]